MYMVEVTSKYKTGVLWYLVNHATYAVDSERAKYDKGYIKTFRTEKEANEEISDILRDHLLRKTYYSTYLQVEEFNELKFNVKKA